MILVSFFCVSRCRFISVHLSRNGTQLKIIRLLKKNKNKKTTAIIDRQQSVTPAGQQSESAGEVRLFPHISSNLSCLAVGHFHWLFPQTETCDYRGEHHEKNWPSDACFSFLNGGKQSGGTHMILTGSCLKVSLMVRLCLAFVLLQWKLQNKEGRTTQ